MANPFIDADEDPLSTFALDGDTASYQILKQYLRDGHLAPPNSVRIEEYVNSLPQGYAPTDTALGLHLNAGSSPFGDPGYAQQRVGIINLEPPVDRAPVSLIFVVDLSGSMASDNRLGVAKEVIYGVVDRMQAGDRAAIVTYAAAGLTRAYDLASGELERRRKVRLALFSDGVANVGATGPDSRKRFRLGDGVFIRHSGASRNLVAPARQVYAPTT